MLVASVVMTIRRRYDDHYLLACDCCISGKAAVARHDTHEHDDNDVINASGAASARRRVSASALVSAVMVDAECWVWVGGS